MSPRALMARKVDNMQERMAKEQMATQRLKQVVEIKKTHTNRNKASTIYQADVYLALPLRNATKF